MKKKNIFIRAAMMLYYRDALMSLVARVYLQFLHSFVICHCVSSSSNSRVRVAANDYILC